MFYIILLIAVEIAFSIIAVNKYWRYRLKDLGTPEGNWITMVGIVMVMILLFQFVNLFVVMLVAVGLAEMARNQLVKQQAHEAAVLATPAKAVNQVPQQSVTPAAPLKAARRVIPKGTVSASSANPGMSRYKVKKP